VTRCPRTTEKGFEQAIEAHLLANGYASRTYPLPNSTAPTFKKIKKSGVRPN
jgi:hypothetical protein